jgi:tetratricopeptide (TPR) repeat protein
VVVVVPLFAAIEPAPGTVITEEKSISDAWIEIETTDGVLFYLGDWKSPAKVAVTRKRGQYKSVVYNGNGEDANFLRAEVLYANGEYEKAPEFYKKAVTTAKWNWEIEQAYRRGAVCLARHNKGAEALEMLKEYVTKYPKNVHMAEVVSLRAQLGLAASDFATAMNDYKEMTKQGALWGPNAELEGHLGQRSVLVAQKKHEDAVALLSGYWSKIKVKDDPVAFGQVGLAIAEELVALTKEADAVTTLRKIYLAPISTEDQCKARLLSARPTTFRQSRHAASR